MSLVSIVTLTMPGREYMLERCKSYVQAQTIQCEHIIVTGEASIGAKRNAGCLIASGDVICMFDDDDYYAPDYIEVSLGAIKLGADVTGLSNAYFYSGSEAWEYKYLGRQPYVIGSGMMFKREVWERSKFPEINEGEEIGFLTNAGRIVPHNYKEGFVAMIHGGNTASHRQLKHMTKIDISIPQNIINGLGNTY